MKTQIPEIGVMGQFSTQNVLDDLDFVIKNNFQWFEIALDWKQNFNLSTETLNEIKKRARKNKIKLIVHTAWYLPTCTIIPELQKVVIQNIKKGIVIAKKVGADRVTVHPGMREMPPPGLQLNYEALNETLKELVSFAKKYKISICLENLDKNPSMWGVSNENYLKMRNSVPGIKTTLDIGHANTSETSVGEYLDLVKDTIMDMHVHDNSGEHDEHKCLGEGNVDFVKLFKKCKEIGYFGPFTLELFPYENLLKGKQRLFEAWEKA